MTTPELLRRAAAPLAAAALVLAMGAPAGAAGAAGAEDPGPRSGVAAAEAREADTPSSEPNVADEGDDAHPSGRDRSVEPGRSGDQGRAAYEPDQDGHGPERDHGGLDQPGGPGGVDLDDQDGNNGCGNDDDFEDDNEGLCRGREGAPGQEDDLDGEVVDGGEDRQPVEELPGTGDDVDGEDVAGDDLVEGAPQAPAPSGTAVLGDVVTRPATAEAEVLGVSVTRPLGALAADTEADASAGTLPRTGAGLLALAGFGVSLAGIGAVVSRLARKDRTA